MYAKAISFRDLQFNYGFTWFPSHDGKDTQRWVPLGMPRIGQEIERTVFFLFQRHWQTGEYSEPKGTGFFVCKKAESLEADWHFYAITNKHVAQQFSDIRINEADGRATYWDYEPVDWVLSDVDDLAALDVTDRIPFSEDNGYQGCPISFVMEDDFVSEKWKSDYSIGIGDQTIMLGLFTEHDGGKMNIPVGRFGFIAATPNAEAPILLRGDDKARPAWLNDTHSRYGYSGSPVWVWRSKYDDLGAHRNQSWGYWPESPRQSFLFLLGCHRGQFREDTQVFAAESRPEPKLLKSGDDVEIPGAMTVVVPAWSISELLKDPKLSQQREARERRPERRRRSSAMLKNIRREE